MKKYTEPIMDILYILNTEVIVMSGQENGIEIDNGSFWD